MKIEVKGKIKEKKGLGEIITIGFIHDTIKNYFIVSVIEEELDEDKFDLLIQKKLFVNDMTFLNFLKEYFMDN